MGPQGDQHLDRNLGPTSEPVCGPHVGPKGTNIWTETWRPSGPTCRPVFGPDVGPQGTNIWTKTCAVYLGGISAPRFRENQFQYFYIFGIGDFFQVISTCRYSKEIGFTWGTAGACLYLPGARFDRMSVHAVRASF